MYDNVLPSVNDHVEMDLITMRRYIKLLLYLYNILNAAIPGGGMSNTARSRATYGDIISPHALPRADAYGIKNKATEGIRARPAAAKSLDLVSCLINKEFRLYMRVKVRRKSILTWSNQN
jgi:hypothetical protein